MLADGHGLYDDRIYWKEAISLSRAGHRVYYILAGEKPETGKTKEGIEFRVLRKDRFPGKPWLNFIAKRWPGGLYDRMLKEASKTSAGVYHIHDLKVNRIGDRLKKLPHKPKVIYDVHEPYPENILDYWKDRRVLRYFRKVWAAYTRRWEKKAVQNYDGIITTEENMAHRFRNYYPDKPVEVIYNYTNLTNEDSLTKTLAKKYDAIYTGGITKYRGAWKILESVLWVKDKKPDVLVLLIGTWFPPALKEEMQTYIRKNELQPNIVFKDAVPYDKIADFYRQSKIGLGIFLPIRTHEIILQIKIFEYMNFGLPIVGSNFGHIHRIVQQHGCGISVDPENPEAIAEALLTLLYDEQQYVQMSNNARAAAQENYRWETMEKKLTTLYTDLSGTSHDQ